MTTAVSAEVTPVDSTVTEPDTGKHAAEDVTEEFEEFTGLGDLTSVDHYTIEPVKVPEWKRTVYLRSMSGKARDNWLLAIQDKKIGNVVRPGGDNQTAKFLVRCICDAQGNLVLKPQDAPALGEEDAAVLTRLFQIALKLSGMAADSIEDAEGNSESESDASTSD